MAQMGVFPMLYLGKWRSYAIGWIVLKMSIFPKMVLECYTPIEAKMKAFPRPSPGAYGMGGCV